MAEPVLIQSVQKAGILLGAFTPEAPSHSLAALAKRFQWNPSSTLRLANSLVAIGLLERNGSGQQVRFTVGLRALQLASTVSSGLDVRRVAVPHMRRLASEMGDTAYLYLRRGNKAVCVERIIGSYAVHVGSIRVGDEVFLTRGAAATAILAYLDEANQLAALNQPGVPELDPERWLLRAADIRKLGYSCTRGEMYPETAGVAVPVFGSADEPVGALCLGGVRERFTADREKSIAEALEHAGADVSERLSSFVPD